MRRRVKYGMLFVFHLSPSEARLDARMPWSDLYLPCRTQTLPRQDPLAQGGQAQRFHLQPIPIGPDMVHLRAHCLGGDQCLSADTHHLHPGVRWYWRSCYWFGWQGQSVSVPASRPLAASDFVLFVQKLSHTNSRKFDPKNVGAVLIRSRRMVVANDLFCLKIYC